MRLIDADELKTAFPASENSTPVLIASVRATINHMPTIELERKRGKWEMLQMPISPPVYKCSVCGSHALQSMTGCLMNRHYEANLTNYCPNCGARMEGVGEQE